MLRGEINVVFVGILVVQGDKVVVDVEVVHRVVVVVFVVLPIVAVFIVILVVVVVVVGPWE